MNDPAKKKIKGQNASQKFRPEYSEKWSFIVRCSREHYVHCKVCGSDFSIKHAGKYDITRHVQCPKHIQRTKDVPLSKSLEDFVKAVVF